MFLAFLLERQGIDKLEGTRLGAYEMLERFSQ